jgi:hypothetical protein
MTSKETVEEKLKNLAQSIRPDDKLFENVMSRIDTKPFAHSRRIEKLSAKLIARRLIMNRFTKLAVAAVLIAAVSLSIIILDKSATPAYGITDVPELLSKARVIHVQGLMYFPGDTMPDGQEIPPVEMEQWIDLENGRVRFTSCGLSSNQNSVRITEGETISDGQYKLILLHTDKSAIFFKISEYQRMLEKRHSLDQMFGQLFGDADRLDSFVKTGQEEIRGVECDIWEGEVVHSVTKNAVRYKYWLSPSTGESNLVQAWRKLSNGQYQLHYEYSKIERDVAVPDRVFAMEVPQGYELRNTRETAIPLELDDGASVHSGSLTLDSRISFTLSDGSVILGWYSLDRESETSQEDLFENLEFGGSLPKLPVEIWGMKPSGWTGDITYLGWHLAYTKKAGKFIEWSLYVPEGSPPARSEMLGYDVLYRFNLEEEPKWRIAYTLDYGIEIKSKEDFDIWVRGAIAELSDDGGAPDDVSYESVLQLAERLRESLAQ